MDSGTEAGRLALNSVEKCDDPWPTLVVEAGLGVWPHPKRKAFVPIVSFHDWEWTVAREVVPQAMGS